MLVNVTQLGRRKWKEEDKEKEEEGAGKTTLMDTLSPLGSAATEVYSRIMETSLVDFRYMELRITLMSCCVCTVDKERFAAFLIVSNSSADVLQLILWKKNERHCAISINFTTG